LKGGKVKLTEETKYPWEGRVKFTVDPEQPFLFDFNLRIPGWCDGACAVFLNEDQLAEAAPDHGYVRISRTWKKGDVVTLDLPMSVRKTHADPHVPADIGRIALQRGPIVYCLEGVDNPQSHVRNLCLPQNVEPVTNFESDLLGGVVTVSGTALAVSRDEHGNLLNQPVRFKAVPYATWDNRQPGEMAVWIPEDPQLAEIPGEDGVLSEGVRIRASHVYRGDNLAALNDGVLPHGSGDQKSPRMTWWDHKGTSEWVEYHFRTPRQIGTSAAYWFSDEGHGQCRVPAEWRLLWRDGNDWKPVKLTSGSGYSRHLDRLNKVDFEPVTTSALRLEVTLQPKYSGGILEWTAAAGN